MRVVVAGGSGFIGQAQCAALLGEGHQAQVLSRNPDRAAGRLPQATLASGYRFRFPRVRDGLEDVLPD
jgi:uncharacterized protein YbjT (DUF2867 family)